MSKWISIEDRLPEPGVWLCAINSDYGRQVRTLDLNEKKQWIHEGEPTFCCAYYFEVTHWMDLPEPPILLERPQK